MHVNKTGRQSKFHQNFGKLMERRRFHFEAVHGSFFGAVHDQQFMGTRAGGRRRLETGISQKFYNFSNEWFHQEYLKAQEKRAATATPWASHFAAFQDSSISRSNPFATSCRRLPIYRIIIQKSPAHVQNARRLGCRRRTAATYLALGAKVQRSNDYASGGQEMIMFAALANDRQLRELKPAHGF